VDTKTRTALVQAFLAEIKQVRARSQNELYGARLNPRERRRARLVESAIADRHSADDGAGGRWSRDDMFDAAMRRNVRGHGINRPRGLYRQRLVEQDRDAYEASALAPSAADLDNQRNEREARIQMRRVGMRRRRTFNLARR